MSALFCLYLFKPRPQVAQEPLAGANVGQGRDVIQAMLARGQQGGARMGRAAFLAPLISTSPFSGRPPSMTILSILKFAEKRSFVGLRSSTKLW